MPYILGFLVLAFIFYYAWPFILLGAVCSAGLLAYRQHTRQQNIKLIEACLPQVDNLFSGALYMSERHPLRFCRVSGLSVCGHAGRESVCICIDTIYSEQDNEGAHAHYWTTRDTHPSGIINSFPTEYTTDSICGSIKKILSTLNLVCLPDESLDHKVCSIIFQNYPEAVWADESLVKIREAMRPLNHAYEVSLDNELLSSNTPLLRRALDALENEARVLLEYRDEAYLAMNKCAQFLSVPHELRNVVDYGIETLQIYSKRNEMRQSLAEVLAIKDEYEALRGL
jgi:hypothetical protein